MALVDYGSDSDDEPTPVASAPAPAAPPPKKRAKGPVRILLDLPKPAASEAPPAKKPRFALGGSVSGLAALLPPPKHESVAVKLEQALADVPSKTVAVAGASGAHVAVNAASVGFVPHRVAKSKKPAPVPLPEVDFFGLGQAEPTASTSALPIFKPSLSISSAPSVVSSSFGAPATAKDPYPGFVQNAEGTWVAKDQETYDLYVASIAEAAAPVLPKGFDESAMNRGGMLEVDAAQQRKAYVERPAQLPKPEVAIPLKLQVQPGTAAGKRRGQLSALLADAHSNRAEMEERIALGRANRKAAGNKYGF